MSTATPGDAASLACVRRQALERRVAREWVTSGDDVRGVWLVTVTVGGDHLMVRDVREALERLGAERAVGLSARYDIDRAEIRYWDECADAAEAVAQALALWADAEVRERLPGWRIVGLEVADPATARHRREHGPRPDLNVLGEIVPFDA